MRAQNAKSTFHRLRRSRGAMGRYQGTSLLAPRGWRRQPPDGSDGQGGRHAKSSAREKGEKLSHTQHTPRTPWRTHVQYTLTHAPAAPASSGHQSPLHRDAMKCPLCLTLQWWLEDGRAQSPLHLSTLHVAQSTVDALSSSELAAAVLLVRHHPPSTLSSAQPCVGNTLLA